MAEIIGSILGLVVRVFLGGLFLYLGNNSPVLSTMYNYLGISNFSYMEYVFGYFILREIVVFVTFKGPQK